MQDRDQQGENVWIRGRQGRGENDKCKMQEELWVPSRGKGAQQLCYQSLQGKVPANLTQPSREWRKKIRGNEDGSKSDIQVIRAYFILFISTNIFGISNQSTSVCSGGFERTHWGTAIKWFQWWSIMLTKLQYKIKWSLWLINRLSSSTNYKMYELN